MLESYFQYRTEFAKTDCLFQCPKTCAAPGCRSSDVIIEVTLFDLIGLSRALDASVPSLFSEHCRLGLQNIEFNPRYKRLLLKLTKPCHFHQKTHCAVHDSKPLACVLFPEYHLIRDLWSTYTPHPIFSSFPCLNSPITISDKRRRALKRLRRTNRIEEAVSFYFLFGVPYFIIDSKPLSRELKSGFQKKAAISHQEYDDLVVKKLKRIGFLNSFMETLLKLDTHAEIEGVFKTLDQESLSKYLLNQVKRPKTIHTFKGNGIRRLNRKIGPPSLTHTVF